MLSPQYVEQIDLNGGDVGLEQVNPISMTPVLLHPSKLAVFPSSHCSGDMVRLSP
jgi:hypothetical protein